MNNETNKRIAVKTLSYRFFVMLSLILTGLLFAKDSAWIMKFVVFSWTLGLVSYIIHDKIWSYIKIWKDGLYDLRKRSIAKTITWRIWAFIVVFTISMLLMGGRASEALVYTIVSNILFVLVHYTHERVWNKFNWGKE